MNEQEIREAIKSVEYWQSKEPIKRKDIKLLMSLAQSYLSLQGFPEEKKVVKCEHGEIANPCSECQEYNQIIYSYNQARKEFLLALLKKIDGFEEVINEWLSKRHGIKYDGIIARDLSQALRKHLGVE